MGDSLIIQTIAGNGTQVFGGDGGPATSAELSDPSGGSVDGSGNIFISDQYNFRIREVMAATGNIRTVAGNGNIGFGGDGGPAINASFGGIFGPKVSLDGSGNVFIGDGTDFRILEVVAATGNIQSVAGNGNSGFSGRWCPATSAEFNGPVGVSVDSSGIFSLLIQVTIAFGKLWPQQEMFRQLQGMELLGSAAMAARPPMLNLTLTIFMLECSSTVLGIFSLLIQVTIAFGKLWPRREYSDRRREWHRRVQRRRNSRDGVGIKRTYRCVRRRFWEYFHC